MSWTNPKTWLSAVLSAADMNTHVRDNLLETAPAKVTTAGDIVYATGANALTRLGIGSAGQRLQVVSGVPAWVAPGTILGSDVTKNSSTSYSDITGLSFSIGANEKWAFELWLIVVGNSTMDFKMSFTYPASPSLAKGYWSTILTGVAGDQYADLNGDFVYDLQGSSVQMLPLFRGIILNGSNAGTVQARYAQNTSNGTDLSVKAGSILRTWKL